MDSSSAEAETETPVKRPPASPASPGSGENGVVPDRRFESHQGEEPVEEPSTPDNKMKEGDQELPEEGSPSELSDVPMGSPFGLEENLEPQTKEEEEDNSLVVYHCWVCSVEFIDKFSIIRHLKEWHKDRPDLHGLDRLMKVPVCMECGVQGPCEHQDGERHDDDDGATAYRCRPRFMVCSSCPEQFLNAEAVRIHRAEAHPDEPSHQCTYCPEVFDDHPSLVVHNRIHLGGRPYICTTCGNRFSKISDLKRHERIHSGEKPFKCMSCNQSFTQKSSLEKHAKIHARRSGCIACLQCGLLFKEIEDLKAHAKEMHKGSNFVCGTCGKMYSEERYLLLHEKAHASDNLKPWACSYCDRRFTLQVTLEKHEKKNHLFKRDIKCHLCNKVFKRNENLTRHMLSHSGVKNFQCSECGVGFTEKGSLTRHFKAQHQQLRPHSCPICRRTFTRKVLVRKHMERFHVQKARELVKERGKFFRCRLCLKLLRKSGKRQHERHHRSKGDVWEGSLEEDLDGGERGEVGDLDTVLGPEVARLVSGKGGPEVIDNGEDEDEDDEEEDEADEDKNEDDDEYENDEDMEEDPGPPRPRRSSRYGGKMTVSDDDEEEEEEEEKPENSEEERREYNEGPVFPEFSAVRTHPNPEASNKSEYAELEDDANYPSYREVGVIESSRVRDHLEGKSRLQDEVEPRSSAPLYREEDPVVPQNMAEPSLSEESRRTLEHSNARLKEVNLEVHARRDISKARPQEEPGLKQQRVPDQRAPEFETRAEHISEAPPATEDSRLRGYREARDSQFAAGSAMYESRRALERGSAYAQGDGNPDVYSDSREQQYMEDGAMGMSRHVDPRDLSAFQYPDQGRGADAGYQDAGVHRLEQKNLSVASHYREPSYRGEVEEERYRRHQGDGEVEQRNQSDAEERRVREAAAYAYSATGEPRQRGPAVSQAELDDPRYREAAAAYAMMGITGYPDPRVMGSRQQGQNYLGMYPWYSETALTHAMMGSRGSQLQGMMGNLGYAGSGFVDSRLRDQQGSSRGEDQPYRSGGGEVGDPVYRDDLYAQELSRQRNYEGTSDPRYRGQGQGDVAEPQYRGQGDPRESRYPQGHGMVRSEQREDIGGMEDRPYPGINLNQGQGGSIHRSWM